MFINESISISRESESIWKYWMDVTNDVHWRDGIIRAEWTSQPPYGPGSTGEHIHEKMGVMKWEVTSFEDRNSFEFIHTEGGLKGSLARFKVEPEPLGSRIQVQMKVSGPFFMRILILFMGRVMRRGVRGDLLKLKEILEKQKPDA